ncbi:MAG: diguanylate cyclase [Lachnospiraceae bacterium]|nr:diguanylate cyclase [Lachnospiraceae bacterium]
MDTNEREINRNLILGWTAIVAILAVAYSFEVVKHERTIGYVVLFIMVTGIPALLCAILYGKNPDNPRLRYWIVSGYFIMYIFSLYTGSTMLVFTYILPMLAFLILFHQPKLIFWTGVAALAVNAFFIGVHFLNGEITVQNSKDIEIQLAVIIYCFAASHLASRMYDSSRKKNLEYMWELDAKSQEIQQMTLQTIEAIANTIDAKDEYTRGHSKRVSDYSAEIAASMGMSEEEVLNIRYVALLHDIGKIGVPDAVLNKPGKLTNEEYELMKQHTTIGGDILKDIGLLPDLDVGAKYHHERYDGKGYPKGLEGKVIPQIARIIGLADAFDAMNSNRVYRKHLDRESIIEEIKRCSGTQFDPEIVEAFMPYLEQDEIWNAHTSEPEEDSTLVGMGSRLLEKIVIGQTQQTNKSDEKDELTGLYKRAAGEKFTAELIEKQKNGCLVLLNLDNMRLINRRFGFRRGDYYLQTVANLLLDIAVFGVVTRVDGDEFMIYLPGITKPEEVQDLIDDFHKKINNMREKDELLESLSISAGITFCEDGKKELYQLMREADKAMYHVKQNYKDGYGFYKEVIGAKEDAQFNRSELQKMLEAMERRKKMSKDELAGHEDFYELYESIYQIMKKNKETVYLIMYMAKPWKGNKLEVDERDEVLGILQKAVSKNLQEDGMASRYSSAQCIVLVRNRTKEDVDSLIDIILKDFYRMYDKKDVEIFCDVAEVRDGGKKSSILER